MKLSDRPLLEVPHPVGGKRSRDKVVRYDPFASCSSVSSSAVLHSGSSWLQSDRSTEAWDFGISVQPHQGHLVQTSSAGAHEEKQGRRAAQKYPIQLHPSTSDLLLTQLLKFITVCFLHSN
jgi:hypothetical protein